jgi:hypothetical protein
MTWDDGQQAIRKLGDVLSGVLLAYGVVAQDLVVGIVGAVTGVLSVAWWIYWNRTRPAADGTPPAV